MEVEKTSVLEELVQHFNYILSDQFDSYDEMREDQRFYIDRIEQAEKISDLEKRRKSIQEAKKMLEFLYRIARKISKGKFYFCIL